MSRRARDQIAAALAVAIALGAAGAAPARADAPDRASADAEAAALLRELKSYQRVLLLDGMRAKAARLERARRRGVSARAQLASRPPRDRDEVGGPQGLAPGARFPSFEALEAPANRAVSDRSRDLTPFATQAEASLAAIGSHVVAAWNDGEGQRTGASEIGYGWSVDGGESWRDGGALPTGGGVAKWLSDPVVTADERRGWFYACGIVITSATSNGIGVVRGRFADGAFAWESPALARAVRDTLPDKPWIAADSSSGRVHLSYTTFFRLDERQTDQIEFQTAAGPEGPWSPPRVLSAIEDRGLVQGSRPAVGPRGEVYVTWTAVDTNRAADGRDRLRVRRSDDGGATFGPSRDAASLFANFGSGAPGFNRGAGLTFPSIAVDRSDGPRRGRVYVAWHECVNFFRAALDTTKPRREAEPNDAPAAATPFTLGDMVRGTIGSPNDIDHFVLSASQGATIVLFLDSLATGLDVAFRLLSADGATRLAYSAPTGVRRRLIVFTLPLGGPWLVRIAPNSGVTGAYRFRTALHVPGPERARDHRDVFVAWSDDGATWSEPRRVNDDPPHFDDWLPEVAVAPDGAVYAAWYDWRDGPPTSYGGVSSVRVARSWTGGETWSPVGVVSSLPTAWSQVASNLAPNQGDYIALAAGGDAVHAAWADGRHGDPDVVAVRIALPGPVAGEAVEVRPGRARLAWRLPPDAGTRAAIERRRGDGPWTFRASATADDDGRIAWSEDDLEPGVRYGFRLLLIDGGVPRPAGEITVDVPPRPALAIRAIEPNPTTGPVRVRFALPADGPAVVELLDLAGRRVRAAPVGGRGAGEDVVDLAPGRPLAPGVYLVRIVQRGASAAARVVVLR